MPGIVVAGRVLLCCDPGRLSVASLPNPPFLPTVGWMWVAAWVVVVPTVMWPVDLDFFGLDLGWVVRATLVAPAAARSRTARRSAVRRALLPMVGGKLQAPHRICRDPVTPQQ